MMDAADSNAATLAGSDRLSRLDDGALGRILSFLPAVEDARAAALSRRWRHVFAAVHTLSFREAERPLSMVYPWFQLCDYCDPGGDPDSVLPPRLVAGVGAALFGRDRGPRAAPAIAPLRALRVAFDEFGYQGGAVAWKAIDGWLSYAGYHAADELEIDLRLDAAAELVCKRDYVLLPPVLADAEDGGGEQEQEVSPHVMDTDADPGHDGSSSDGGDEQIMDDDDDYTEASSESRSLTGDQTMEDDDYGEASSGSLSPAGDQTMDDDDYAGASSGAAAAGDADDPYPWRMAGKGYAIYVTPKSLFACSALRSLRLGRCGLDLPSAIALPSLATLHLTRVTARSGAVQRLVAACPRLADLTLEACGGNLTKLSVPSSTRLRRLALRCCHELATVAVGDSSELRAFEYRGAVPAEPQFLTMSGPRKISLCTIDLCGKESVGTPELGNLMHFLRLFAGVERLHLTSARFGCGVGHGAFSSALVFPAFLALRNLELTGMLPEDDISAITAVTRILERTPSLDTLSLFFLPEPHPATTYSYRNDEETIHAAHKLRCDQHATLAVPDVKISCLRERTREINLVHYQGAMAQRMLAKFLLRNARVVDEVWCEFARGPLPMQTKLMREIKGWVLNKSARMKFR
ncbi:unnamed protein product [Urochloa humidicola]